MEWINNLLKHRRQKGAINGRLLRQREVISGGVFCTGICAVQLVHTGFGKGVNSKVTKVADGVQLFNILRMSTA